MPKNQQNRQEVETTASEQIALLHEQLEFCHELVKSLNLELDYQQQKQQELEQELVHTNSELCEALMLEQVCLEEAKAIAETILKSKKSVSESLSELLSAIYGSPVKLTELETDKLEITKPLRSANANNIVQNLRELREYSKQNYAQFKELGFQFISLRARYIEFNVRSAELRNKLKAKKAKTDVTITANESNFPPPKNNIIGIRK